MNLEQFIFFTQNKHYYTFACTGLKGVASRDFSSRQSANEYMYKQCEKHGLKVKDVWKDHHDVTFVCNNNVKFYIQRV